MLVYPRAILDILKNNQAIEYTMDNIKNKSTVLVIGNGKYYGNGVPINPNYDLKNDYLNVLKAPFFNRRDIVKFLLKVLKEKHIDDPLLDYYLVQKLNIKRKSTLDNKTIMLHKLYSSLANKKNNINSIMNLFNKDNKSYLKYNHKYNVIIQGIIYLVLGIIEVSRYAIIFYAIYLVSIGNIEIGTILLIYSYYDKILTNFEVLGTITADYQSFNVSLNRLNKVTMREVIAK